MAPKRNPSSTHSAPAAKPSPSTSTSTATPASTSSKLAQTTTSAPSTRASKSSASAQTTTLSPHSTATEILTGIWNTYLSRTPQRVKLLDTFMAFLVAVGVLQFVYCVAGGNYVRFSFYLFLWLFQGWERRADMVGAIRGR